MSLIYYLFVYFLFLKDDPNKSLLYLRPKIGNQFSRDHIFSQLDNTENYAINMFLFISCFLDFMLCVLRDDFWGSNQ